MPAASHANSVVQYALWLNERTPEQHERLIRWWQDEVEGTGRVPVLSSEQKPEVLRFAGGTDADLRLQWQQFLLTMIANAFDLPAMLLGVTQDVNRSTAQELPDEAFQSAVVPLAKLIAEHITRDVIVKRLGWSDLRFVWSELESRDERVEVEIQTKLLRGGRADCCGGAQHARTSSDHQRSRRPDDKLLTRRSAWTMQCALHRSVRPRRGWTMRGDGVADSGGGGAPERLPFEGCLTLVDVASDRAPSGARGHRVVLTREAAEAALPSLLGMAVDYKAGWDGHDARQKCGIITTAQLERTQADGGGYLFARDFPSSARLEGTLGGD